MSEKQIITFRGNKSLWDEWVLLLRKNKIGIWDKLEHFIKEDIKNEK